MNKAQGSIEYLLILGGVIMVAVIVISVLVRLTPGPEKEIDTGTINLFCSHKAINNCCGQTVKYDGQTYGCKVDATNTQCKWEVTIGSGSLLNCCNDGVINQDETATNGAVNCGGVCTSLATPQKCNAGQACKKNSDCQSNNCQSNICA